MVDLKSLVIFISPATFRLRVFGFIYSGSLNSEFEVGTNKKKKRKKDKH